MRAKSQASHDAVLSEFEPVADASGKDGLTLAEQLFTVVDALDSSSSLRRAMTDPARPGADKSVLVTHLFADSDSRVQDVLSSFVEHRWSGEHDLGDSIEDAGVMALLAHAEAHGTLEAVEEELFRVERLLITESDLRVAMGNRSATKQMRLELFESVLGAQLSTVTKALLTRVVGSPRGMRIVASIEEIITAASKRRGRIVAWVTSAVELSAAQRKRLGSILEGAYGRPVQINVAVDPEVLGGMSVKVGSQVVDGTILTRLDDARRLLVG